MALFSLHCLMDKKGTYKSMTQDIVTQRFKTLYGAVGIPHPENAYDAIGKGISSLLEEYHHTWTAEGG
jgi:hypothetical protein